MLINAGSILFGLMVITFKMETITAGTGSALLVTYIPNPYSYCQFPITESGIPMTNSSCTKFISSVYFLDACAWYESDVFLLYEYTTGTIYKERNHSHVDNRTWTRLHTGPASIYTTITFDWLSKSLYWTDPFYGWIGVISLMNDDFGMYRILVHENIQRPYGITLDPFQGILFWTDIGRTVKIEKSNMSGDDRMVLISFGLITPYSLTADIRAERIFWIDDGRDTIESAQYDGTGRKIIRRISHAVLFDIEVFKDLVYVSETESKVVYVMDKINGVIRRQLPYADHTPLGIAMYHPDTQPTTGTDHCRTLQCNHICVSRKDGAVCMCKEGFRLNTDGKNCSEDTKRFQRGLIVSNATSFCVADIHAISASGYNSTCFLRATGVTHFELDTSRRELIFANSSGLYYTSVDWFSINRLLTVSGRISGLGFDWIDQSIFWSENDTGTISFVSRLGTNTWTILSGLDSPRNLLVLPLESRIFWVSGSSSMLKIESSNFDGSDRRDVVKISFSLNPASISFDPSSKRLYFVNNTYITCCYLNGSDVRKLSSVPSNTDSVYVYKGYLILHSRMLSNSMSEIQSFSIEGLSLTKQYPTQIRSIGRITDLKVYDDRLQPSRKGPCDELNGGCEQICIATGLVNRVCRCQFGFHQDTPNGNTCSSSPVSNNFLLVSDWTHDMIYQLSLDTNDVQAVDIKKITDPTGIAYDHARKTVVWGSSAEREIFSVSINGTDESFLFSTGDMYNTHPDRLAIDFSTGNIYYTAVSVNELVNPHGGYIAVLSVHSLHKLLITALERPRDIALYPSKGLMFWTDHGSNAHIGRAEMDGQKSREIINTSVTWPNGLALDYSANRLYWSDGDSDVVESCNLNGDDRRVIFHDSGAHLMDIAYDNAGNLYFTAWNRPYITKLMLSQQFQVVHLFDKPELGRLDALDIYTADNQPRNPFCSYNNGNCSTFCLPNMYGRNCSCEDGVSILEDGKTCSNIPTTTTTPRVPMTTTTTSSTSKQTKTSTSLSTTTETISSRPTTTANKPFPPPNDVVTSGNNQTLIAIAAGGSAGFVVLIVAIFLIICCIRRRTNSRQGRSERIISDRDDSELQPSTREANGSERPASSVSNIYDNIQDDLYNYDTKYMTVRFDNNELNGQSVAYMPQDDLHSSDPDYLTAQTDTNKLRPESAQIRPQDDRVGQDLPYPDYETLMKTKETAYPQTTDASKGRTLDYETPVGRPLNDYTHMREIPKLPARRDTKFGRTNQDVEQLAFHLVTGASTECLEPQNIILDPEQLNN